MERWTALNEFNLATYQAGPYIDAFKTAALLDGQENPLPEAIRTTVLKIRGAIKSGKYSVDRNPEKIPGELINDALALIVGIVKPRIDQELSQDERDALSRAHSLLMKIAEGKFDVSAPDDPEAAAATTQSTGGASLVLPGRRTPKRSDYDGL